MEQLNPHSINYNTPMTTYAGYDLNPAYQTPSHMANFRPAYQEQNSAYADSAVDDIGNSIQNGIGTAAQYAGIPLASWYVANKMFGKTGIADAAGRGLGGMAAGGINSGLRNSIGRIGGGWVGSNAVSRTMGAGFMKGMRGLGSLVGGPGLVMGAGAILASGLEKGAVNSYNDTRSGMGMMTENMRNVFTGEGRAGLKGVSQERSHELSSKFTRMGVEDFRFDQADFQEVADLSMRSGIMNEHLMLNKDDIVKAVKQTTDMVKLIGDITGDKDFQKSIDYIAKLKRGGIAGEQVRGAMSTLQHASSVSGISIDQLMDTVGTQGQVAYQRAGLMPGQGLTNSSSTYAGFVNAFRSGLISNAQMATLGGVDGATQRLSEGAIQSGTDHFSVLMGMTGEDTNSKALSRFNSFGDPVAAMGNMYLNRGAYSQRFMQDKTEGGTILAKLIADAKEIHGEDVNIDANLMGAMGQMNGYDPLTVQAALIENDSRRQFGYQDNERKARYAGNLERTMNYQENEGTDNSGSWFGRWFDKTRSGIRRFGREMGDETGTAAAGLTAGMQDWAWELMNVTALGFDKNETFEYNGNSVSIAAGNWEKGRVSAGARQADGTYKSADRWVGDEKQSIMLSKLVTGMQSANPEIKKAALAAYEKAKSGNYNEAMRDFNLATDGGLYGTVDKFRVEDLQNAIQGDNPEFTIRELQTDGLDGYGNLGEEWDGVGRKGVDYLRRQMRNKDLGLSKMSESYFNEWKDGAKTSAAELVPHILKGGEKRKEGESEQAWSDRVQRLMYDNFDKFRTEGMLNYDAIDKEGVTTDEGFMKDTVLDIAKQANIPKELMPHFIKNSKAIYSELDLKPDDRAGVLERWQDSAKQSISSAKQTFDISGVQGSLVDVGKDMDSLKDVVGGNAGLTAQMSTLAKTIKSINDSQTFRDFGKTIQTARKYP